MAVDHGLLNGMQAVVRQALDGNQLLAVECRQELDAGVDRANPDALPAAIEFGDHHRTGTAIAFGTTLFRPGATQVLTQKLQHGPRGIDILEFHDPAVEHEAYRAPGRFHRLRTRHVPQLPR